MSEREEQLVKVRVVVDDEMPAAAAFTAGSTDEGAAEITVNLAFHMACAKLLGESLPEVLRSWPSGTGYTDSTRARGRVA